MPSSTANNHYFIGQAAELSGVHIETIRYYERIGVMPAAPRSPGKQRLYNGEQLKRLRFIKRSRELGFSLDEIRSLLSLSDEHQLSCADVHRLTVGHLEQVQQKLAQLSNIEATLKDMAKQCSQGDVPDCPIIETLNRV